MDALAGDAKTCNLKLTAKGKQQLRDSLTERGDQSEPVVEKRYKPEANPLHCLSEATREGRRCVVEYEPEPKAPDKEQVTLQAEAGSQAFLRREVPPYAPG